MNRPLTEVFSQRYGVDPTYQSETPHRYVLGLYEIQARLLKRFPYLKIENCASGGGRFDLGKLC